MPAPTLRALALKKAISNVDDIEYVPEVPYETIRPILRVVKTADQLHKIETSSPQIIGQISEIWKSLIRRDADIDLKNIPEPKDAAKWWKVYRKLMAERTAKYEKSAAALKAAMDKHKADKDSYSTETLSQHAAKLPHRTSYGARNSRPKQASGSGFLSRVREQSKEKASLRKTSSVLKGHPAAIGKVRYAPKGLADKLPGAKHSPHVGTSRIAIAPQSTRGTPKDHSSEASPARSSNATLARNRQLGSSSAVFGPNRKRY